MATWNDVRRIALALPETTEGVSWGTPHWKVKDKSFVWDRPLHRSDMQALGDKAPNGPILGVHVDHEGIKQALIAESPDVFFTTPHFEGYPAVLVRLDLIHVPDLEDLIVDAWLARAPKRLAKEYLASRSSVSCGGPS